MKLSGSPLSLGLRFPISTGEGPEVQLMDSRSCSEGSGFCESNVRLRAWPAQHLTRPLTLDPSLWGGAGTENNRDKVSWQHRAWLRGSGDEPSLLPERASWEADCSHLGSIPSFLPSCPGLGSVHCPQKLHQEISCKGPCHRHKYLGLGVGWGDVAGEGGC